MRPIELTLEGFRSYRGKVSFDWRDRRLVGIVGPIGAGKSSILDAIAFALYRRRDDSRVVCLAIVTGLLPACSAGVESPRCRSAAVGSALTPRLGRGH